MQNSGEQTTMATANPTTNTAETTPSNNGPIAAKRSKVEPIYVGVSKTISFEGVAGCGKTTTAERLNLEAGEPVECTRGFRSRNEASGKLFDYKHSNVVSAFFYGQEMCNLETNLYEDRSRWSGPIYDIIHLIMRMYESPSSIGCDQVINCWLEKMLPLMVEALLTIPHMQRLMKSEKTVLILPRDEDKSELTRRLVERDGSYDPLFLQAQLNAFRSVERFLMGRVDFPNIMTIESITLDGDASEYNPGEPAENPIDDEIDERQVKGIMLFLNIVAKIINKKEMNRTLILETIEKLPEDMDWYKKGLMLQNTYVLLGNYYGPNVFTDDPTLTRKYKGDSWDLYATEDVIVEPGKSAAVNLGPLISFKLGYTGKLSLRSSEHKRFLSNSGVVDAGYDSPLKLFAFNVTDEPQKICKGKSFAQLTVQKMDEMEIGHLSDMPVGDTPRSKALLRALKRKYDYSL